MIVGYEHAVQLSVLFKAVGLGYLIGFLFGFFSFFNSVSKNAIAVFFRDILFFVLSAALSFLFLLKYNAGVIRLYIVAGEFIGFLLYHLFPGSFVENFIRKSSDRFLGAVSSKVCRIKKKALCRIKGIFCNLKKKVTEHKITDKKPDEKKENKIVERLKKSRKFLQKKEKK